ncbi:uncharacterized protein LOC143354031 isoform X2 [Halictus rubicundus]|uniref:uncharacterized protein LOC143354031 isoform X2 n=1 Tax=Halictus rubicundus TaxID=77578 RepID=UPI004035DBA4
MSKWSEKLVVKFLKVYKQHPCLWNPYDRRYYNCNEKNEALQRIIDDLRIPGFTVTDYLQQIKLIREKYKNEQLRTIKGLQTQKQYKSPVPWYNIVAEMLMRVINDEAKVSSVGPTRIVPPDTSVLKSLSSDDICHSNRKETKTRIQPCTNATCDIVARRSRSARSSIKYMPRKTTEVRSTARTKYVLCPQARNASKAQDGDRLSTYKPRRDSNSKVLEYPRTPSNSVNSMATDSTKDSTKKYEPPFLKCPSCGWENDEHKTVKSSVEKPKQDQRTITPCANYYSDSPGLKYIPCSGCIKDATYCTIHPETYTDDSGDFVRDFSKPAPAKIPKLDKETQTTESPQLQVVQLDPGEKNAFEGGAIEACTRFKIILPDSKKNSGGIPVGTQSVCQCTQGVQCSKPELCTKGTQLSLELKKNDAHTSTVEYREWGTQCIVCLPEERRRSASIQTINHMQEKQVGVYTVKQNLEDKAVNVNGQASKGTQSTVCVSRGSTARSSSLERTRDVETSSSVQRVHSSGSVTTVCYKSVGTGGECVPPSRAKSHGSLKGCIRQKDYKEAAVGETEAYMKACNAETCPRNMSELIKDPTVTTALQQLLCKMLSSKINHEQKKYSTDCATDATEMVKRIKEFAITALGVDLTKDECVQTLSNAETHSVCVNKLTMTREDPYKLVYRSTGVQGDGSEGAPTLKEAKKLVADKEVCTHCEYRDIGTNGSLLQTRDTGIQNGLDNSVCSNKINIDKQHRITVGTQKRDPILVRVIKCTDSQAIKKSDKETLTLKTEDDLEKKFLDKRVETCGRSTCVPYTICISSNQEEPKFQVNCDYRKRSSMDRCDDNCKGKLYCDQDWTDVTNTDAFNCMHTPKIPLCTTRKCTFARNNY